MTIRMRSSGRSTGQTTGRSGQTTGRITGRSRVRPLAARTALPGVAALLLAAGGCGVEDPGGADDVSLISSAITRTDFSDATGDILVRVKTCDATPMQATNCAYCIVDQGWARVGGGAEILGQATPGARLKASIPDWFVSTFAPANCTGEAGVPNVTNRIWIARSSGPSHQLRAYVIGMQVRNSSGVASAPIVSERVDRVANFAGSPSVATVDADTVSIQESGGGANLLLIGGGAEVVPSSTNAFITESAPVSGPNGVAWRASARSDDAVGDGGVKSWVIGLEGCPAQWAGSDCFSYPSIRSLTAGSTSGYGTSSYTLPASWVSPSMGGRSATSSGGGRNLVDLIPLNGSNKGFTVRSNRGLTTSSGATHGFALAIGRSGAPYQFNAIRFNVNGTAFYRPSGSNPRLQQGTAFPDAPALNWHLEHLGSGVYRLRNGNPDGGSECAYRQSGTTLRVTTCGSGNEFRWTLFSGATNGVFQLRNVAANQCIDNNNQGWVNGNLVLKNCSAGFDAAQSLFPDAFSWPPP